MWHASISFRDGTTDLQITHPHIGGLGRYIAGLALDGVGSDRGEWWLHNRRTSIMHLRVPTTADEQLVCGDGLPEWDAGEVGTFTRGRRSPADLLKGLR